MLIIILIVEVGRILLLMLEKMLNYRLVVDVGSDFDSLNFAPFRLPYLSADQSARTILVIL